MIQRRSTRTPLQRRSRRLMKVSRHSLKSFCCLSRTLLFLALVCSMNRSPPTRPRFSMRALPRAPSNRRTQACVSAASSSSSDAHKNSTLFVRKSSATLGYNRRSLFRAVRAFAKSIRKHSGCRLNAVGIPVLHAETQYTSRIGSWHRDVNPASQKAEDKRWVTVNNKSAVFCRID